MTEQADELRSIKDTNAYLRSLVETQENLREKFWIGGVVAYSYTSELGHVYFTLEAEGFSIDCMLPNKHSEKAVFIVKGAGLDVYGGIRFYEKKAQSQILVENLRLAKSNKAKIDPHVLLQLKEQGLWPRPKRELPHPPKHIALITSQSSDALNDFREKYRAENGQAQIHPMYAPIQGEDAAIRIADRIADANRHQELDIIVIVRGGGSKADLSTFDDIRVAEAICRSRLPIITGIGHQPDETIADQLADYSTITPTDAADKLARLEPTGQKVSVAEQGQFKEAPKYK
jgi:exodeoxyribonuclease VII large subunit